MKARDIERLAFGALATVAVVGFEHWGAIDLELATYFHAGGGRFPAGEWLWVQGVYWTVPRIGRAMFVLSLACVVLAWWRPAQVPRHRWRRATALMLCLLLGLGALVHGVFKDHWGRPRPNEIAEFAGPHSFVPALHRSTACARNCSFVSGHAATGFALIGLGMFAAPRRRLGWLVAGASCGLVIGLVRMAQGRHFASDIIFALIIMWGSAMLLREVWLRVTLLRQRTLRPAPGVVALR
jgi:lipid A 4'-phosphatase